MIRDAVMALMSFFVIQPMQTSLERALTSAGAPPAIVQSVAPCATAAAPQLAERAMNDPVWAVSTAIGVWTGASTPENVLADAAPQCGPVIRAASGFLRARGA